MLLDQVVEESWYPRYPQCMNGNIHHGQELLNSLTLVVEVQVMLTEKVLGEPNRIPGHGLLMRKLQ